MPLTMRPTALASPVTRQDFTVYCGKWAMGRIYEKSHHMRWFWSLAWSASRLACTRMTTRRRSKKPRLS
jgi:hypothetical protein